MIVDRSLLFLLLVTSHGIAAQNICTTPENTSGLCINISNCEPIMQILQDRRPKSREFLNYLQSLQCGFEGSIPKICCELKPPPTTTTERTSPDTTVVDPPDVSNHPNLQLINSDICGPASNTRIFGGNATEIFEYPWMALLAYRSPGQATKSFKCGGTVINKRYVLTAAHCVTMLPGGARLTGVRIGEHDISSERDCSIDEMGVELACAEPYQDINIESVKFHQEYSRLNLVNDIALVRLSSDANFEPKNVKPICLPLRSATTPATKKLTVTGWGRTEEKARSDKLLQAQLTPKKTADCAQAYIGKAKIWYKQLCAGGKRGIDSCLGDSGGPLQAQSLYKNSVRYVQYGIVSFGLPNCGTENVPGVYTNVEYYMDWILDNIRP